MEAKLIDYMGDDLRVVNAARVSFKKISGYKLLGSHDELGLEEKDEKLINYLAKHNHWTPFSHPQITIHEKVPIFVARQRFKHMVGFTYNEVSRRYVDDEPEFFTPKEWRGKPVNAKQGSSDEIIDLDNFFSIGGKASKNAIAFTGLGSLSDEVRRAQNKCKNLYINLIESGVAPEQARMVLPQSMYTEYYSTGSLAAWARAYKLRIDPHSQKEIQDLAKQWNEIIEPLFPVSWKALTNE